ncbi:MAG TPA: GDSL-type esterase/lipase family protein [Rhodocyclaceae bacterium]|nr:GDSL-type esterase/lipase family protein [Rhodocyclaceae bacterium]
MVSRTAATRLLLILSLLANLAAIGIGIVYIARNGGWSYLDIKLGLAAPARHTDTALYRGRVDTLTRLPLPGQRTLFIGDSLTDYAPLEQLFDFPLANLGIASDRVGDLSARTGGLDAARPVAVVVWAGINDLLAGRDCHDVAEDLVILAQRYREQMPQARLFVVAVAPLTAHSSRLHGDINVRVRCVNAALARDLAGSGIRFLPLATLANADDGALIDAYSADGLHLNAAGYRAWAQAVGPALTGAGSVGTHAP